MVSTAFRLTYSPSFKIEFHFLIYGINSIGQHATCPIITCHSLIVQSHRLQVISHQHRYKNFEMAAYTLQHPNHPGLNTKEWDVSKFMGFSFDDTDVYKTIEGASYILQTYPDKKLKAYIDSVLDVVGAAQEPDGYLYTARTINPKHRLSEVFSEVLQEFNEFFGCIWLFKKL